MCNEVITFYFSLVFSKLQDFLPKISKANEELEKQVRIEIGVFQQQSQLVFQQQSQLVFQQQSQLVFQKIAVLQQQSQLVVQKIAGVKQQSQLVVQEIHRINQNEMLKYEEHLVSQTFTAIKTSKEHHIKNFNILQKHLQMCWYRIHEINIYKRICKSAGRNKKVL